MANNPILSSVVEEIPPFRTSIRFPAFISAVTSRDAAHMFAEHRRKNHPIMQRREGLVNFTGSSFVAPFSTRLPLLPLPFYRRPCMTHRRVTSNVDTPETRTESNCQKTGKPDVFSPVKESLSGSLS